MLISIKYQANSFRNTDPWILEEIEFDNFNLIAGINSTGKSRMTSVINGLALFIRNNGLNYIGNWEAKFKFADDLYDYRILSGVGSSIKEILLINDVLILEREDDRAKILSETTQEFDYFSPPGDSLVLHVRRDKLAYPFLEKLHDWALNVKFFEFGHIHSYMFNSEYAGRKESVSIENIAQILYDEVSKDGVKRIIENFNKLGYEIRELQVEYITGSPKILIREEGFVNFIEQRVMSQGMFRSLALLVFIEYIRESQVDSLIIIDDLAEGLDYKRATKLAEFLISSSEAPLQIIATSNHDFFLNRVDVKDWIILYRNGINVKSISQKKHPEFFRRFNISGLEPFDLFTTNFIDSYFNDEDINFR